MKEKSIKVGAVRIEKGWLVVSLPEDVLVKALQTAPIMEGSFTFNGVTFTQVADPKTVL